MTTATKIGICLKPGLTWLNLAIQPDVFLENADGLFAYWRHHPEWTDRYPDCKAVMDLLDELHEAGREDDFYYVEYCGHEEPVMSGHWSDNPFGLALAIKVGYDADYISTQHALQAIDKVM